MLHIVPRFFTRFSYPVAFSGFTPYNLSQVFDRVCIAET